MIKYIFLLFTVVSFSQEVVQNHCGLDFTTFLIVKPKYKAEGKIISDLKITIVDHKGDDLINENNNFSYTNLNQPLVFKRNKKINDNDLWDLSLMKEEVYYISLKNEFISQSEDFRIKIVDLSGKLPTETYPIEMINFYKLCQQEIKRFGPKMVNQPIIIEY